MKQKRRIKFMMKFTAAVDRFLAKHLGGRMEE